MTPPILGFTLSIALVISGGCAVNEQVSLVPTSGQEALMRNGNQTLVSRKNHIVMLRPNSRSFKSHSRPAFTVVIRNMGSEPINISENQISAFNTGASKKGVVRVFRHAELVQEEQTRQAVAAFAVALGGVANAMSAANAGNISTSGTFSADGANGRTVSGTYSGSTYDHGRAYAASAHASAQTAADFDRLRTQGEENMKRLEHTILKDHTLMPGEWYGGTVILDSPPRAGDGQRIYTIIVDFAGENHEFSVRQGATAS